MCSGEQQAAAAVDPDDPPLLTLPEVRMITDELAKETCPLETLDVSFNRLSTDHIELLSQVEEDPRSAMSPASLQACVCSRLLIAASWVFSGAAVVGQAPEA